MKMMGFGLETHEKSLKKEHGTLIYDHDFIFYYKIMFVVTHISIQFNCVLFGLHFNIIF